MTAAALPDGWNHIDTVPKDGTEVALLFAREGGALGLRMFPRVRAAYWVGTDWSIPYSSQNLPIAWHAMPEAPAIPTTTNCGGVNESQTPQAGRRPLSEART